MTNDRNMGNIETANQSNLVSAHGIFNNNIYWCENIDILKLYLQDVKQYTLKKLGDNWYYVGFEM